MSTKLKSCFSTDCPKEESAVSTKDLIKSEWMAMTLPRILFSDSSPRMVPAATTMGENTPSLCGLLPFFLGAFFAEAGILAGSVVGATGMGGMSIISFFSSSLAADSSDACWYMSVICSEVSSCIRFSIELYRGRWIDVADGGTTKAWVVVVAAANTTMSACLLIMIMFLREMEDEWSRTN